MDSIFKLGLATVFAALAAAPAAAVSLNVNGLVGTSDSNAKVGVDATLGETDMGAPGSGKLDANANLGTGGTGGGTKADVSVDLGGSQGSGSRSGANEGNAGHADILVDLFGQGSAPDASATVAVGAPTSGGTGTATNLTVDLFGTGSSGSDGTGGQGTAGDTGSGSIGEVSDASGQGTTGGRGSSGLFAAGGDLAGKSCFTPSAAQWAHLAARHDYGPQLLASWLPVSRVQIVDAGLCAGLSAQLAADANIGQLQSFIASNPALRLSLEKRGHAAGEVIAADKRDGMLVVYVL